MTSKYIPSIYKLPSIDVEAIYQDSNVLTSTTINQPLFSLGFHSFIHRTKSAMEITSKLETKNEFYYIVNPFEHIVNDYSESIYNTTPKYFDTKDSIISRSFYKMWEIITIFDIANNPSINVLGLTSGTDSFIQAFIFYRRKFFDIKKDTITFTEADKENQYNKLFTDKTNGKYYDLIIDDGDFNPINKNYIEQETYLFILTNIINAIKSQSKDGSFVLKIYDTFTNVTIKMMYLLTAFYDNVYIYKPFFSRNTESEKYIICTNFKYDQSTESTKKTSKKIKPVSSDLSTKIIFLETTLKQMNTKKFIVDIFPKLILTQQHVNVFKYTNIIMVNNLQISINMLVQYIKSNNYFGNEYHLYHTKQIDANKWWLSTYFTETKPDFVKMIKDLVHYNESELNLFVNRLL